MFFNLNFRSYFEAYGPNRFHFLLKVLLSSKFISKSISWSLKRPLKQPGQFFGGFASLLAALLLGHCGRANRWKERNILAVSELRRELGEFQI